MKNPWIVRATVAASMMLPPGALMAQQDCRSIQDSAARLACFDKSPGPKKSAPAAAKSDPQISAAKSAVAKLLKDPDSARFDALIKKTSPNTRGEPTAVICGQVNAKNSYGGYDGPTPFVFFVNDGSANVVSNRPAPGDVDGAIYRRFCVP